MSHRRWRMLKCYAVHHGGRLDPSDPAIILAQYFGVLHDGRAFYGNGRNMAEARRNLSRTSGVYVPRVAPEPWQWVLRSRA